MCLVDSPSSTCNGLCNYPWNLQHMYRTIFFFYSEPCPDGGHRHWSNYNIGLHKTVTTGSRPLVPRQRRDSLRFLADAKKCFQVCEKGFLSK